MWLETKILPRDRIQDNIVTGLIISKSETEKDKYLISIETCNIDNPKEKPAYGHIILEKLLEFKDTTKVFIKNKFSIGEKVYRKFHEDSAVVGVVTGLYYNVDSVSYFVVFSDSYNMEEEFCSEMLLTIDKNSIQTSTYIDEDDNNF